MEPDGSAELAVADHYGPLQAAAYSAKLLGRESEVPMVSMDGEAHPNMTLAAIGLGVFVALIILLTLIAFITRRERSSHAKGTPSPAPTAQPADRIIDTVSQKVAMAPAAACCTVRFANELELADVITRM